MKKIYKFQIELTEYQLLAMPKDAEIISAQSQDGRICLWAIVDTEQDEIVYRHILLVGTGHRVLDNAKKFIGTVQQGAFVWHLFEC